MVPFLLPKGGPGTIKIKEFCETSSKFCAFALFSWSRLRGPIWDPPGLRFGSLLALKMGETSLGNHLGAAKSRSRGLFSAPRAVQEGSKRAPRPLQELKRLQDGSKTPPGADFNLSGTLRDLKIMIFGGPKVAFFGSLEHSARHPKAFQDILRQACCVKSFPRYSKTSCPGPPS